VKEIWIVRVLLEWILEWNGKTSSTGPRVKHNSTHKSIALNASHASIRVRVVNFKSDEKSDRSIDIFQPIRMLHFDEFSTKLKRPTHEKSDEKSVGSVTY
jgi:hypothetical protein